MEEWFETTDHLGRPSGIIKKRFDVHRDGDWHRSSHLHLIRSRNCIVFQQRSDTKDVFPSLVDVAVGGHHNPGESADEALRREVREEIGIELNRYTENRITIPGFRAAVHEIPEKRILDRELQDVSFLIWDLPLEQLCLQQDEIFGVMEFQLQDVVDLFAGKKDRIQNENGMCFRPDGGLKPYVRSWTKNDFIPSVDNYPGKAAFTAQQILRGERLFPGI